MAKLTTTSLASGLHRGAHTGGLIGTWAPRWHRRVTWGRKPSAPAASWTSDPTETSVPVMLERAAIAAIGRDEDG